MVCNISITEKAAQAIRIYIYNTHSYHIHKMYVITLNAEH